MQHVLIITSAIEAVATLAEGLEREGFTVTLHMPGKESPAPMPGQADAIIVDLTGDWTDEMLRHLLREVQEQGSEVAALVLLRPDQLARYDFTWAVDDFITVPASPQELSLRIRQALWRRSSIDTQNLLKCGELAIDLANYKVFISGRPVSLTFKEYELLRFLATNRDKVFTREALLNRVWGYDFYGGARTVDVHIRRLRSKIETHGHTFIETVRNVGYRFRGGT